MEDIQIPTVEKLINNVVKTENIVNPKVKYTFSEERKGFVGHIANVEITGSNKTLKVIVKYPSTIDSFRDKLKARELYCKEIHFYTEINPLFEKLQIEYGFKEPFNKIAKCYGADTGNKCEMLILEDLIDSGFRLHDSNEPLEEQHIKLVLQEYAKYHAISIAFKHNDFPAYDKLLKGEVSIQGLFGQTQTINIMKDACNNVKDFLVADPKKHEAYGKFCDGIPQIFADYFKFDEFAVMIHGDAWCNNFMFKHDKDTNKVIDVRFLDFQATGPGSLAYDLSYFLMANSPRHVIKNLDVYLKFYYDNLSLRLSDINCVAEEVFSYEVFRDQWKKYNKHGLMMAITVLKVATAASDEMPDLTKDFDNAINFVGTNINEYKKRTLDIIDYYYESGFI